MGCDGGGGGASAAGAGEPDRWVRGASELGGRGDKCIACPGAGVLGLIGIGTGGGMLGGAACEARPN